MGTLAERALLAAVRHVAESGATWPSAELRQAWNRMTMTNCRLACRISSDRIFDWYLRLVWGLEPVVDASAGDSEEGLYDSEGPPGIFAASHIYRGGALQAAVAACSSCEPW